MRPNLHLRLGASIETIRESHARESERMGREAFPGFDPVQSDLIAADGIEELVEAAKNDGLSCFGHVMTLLWGAS